jgi:acetoin utilization deacetylase AcuC-like enzyme
MLRSNKARCAYALCRPPGHHAGYRFFGGFCYLNNAAIAARTLLKEGKVAIIDIDYHHGNGTQDIFWNEGGVFYGSLHGDPSFEYPYSGYADEQGGSAAPGTIMNIPLPAGTTRAPYLSALHQICQAVTEFKPSFLVISVGFDTYVDDPIGSFRLYIEDYTEIGRCLTQLALPTLLVQEGGYTAGMQGLLAERLMQGFLA